MRIGIDAMGGDHAPDEEVKGALAACAMLAEDDRIVLIGRQDEVLARMNGAVDWQRHIEIVHADDVITMGESPVEALRDKAQQFHRETGPDAQGWADRRVHLGG